MMHLATNQGSTQIVQSRSLTFVDWAGGWLHFWYPRMCPKTQCFRLLNMVRLYFMRAINQSYFNSLLRCGLCLCETGPFPTSQFELSSIPATVKELFGLPRFLTKRDAWAAPFTELLTLDSPRQDCPMTLPDPPKGAAAVDSPTLLPEETASGSQVETQPPLQCKSHSVRRRPDDGECSRHEPTRRQLKQMELFSRLTSTPMPDASTMGRGDADTWARQRFVEWHRASGGKPGLLADQGVR